ncbi:MAG: response regulator [Saprospiraceae bacterium]|nr:response regulator [Saprospiraceae bacterium]
MEHILLIEDNLPDVELIKNYLEDASFAYRLYTVKSLQDGLDIIKHHPISVALLDLALDDTTGLPTLNSFFDEVPYIPVVVLTGNVNEVLGMNAIRAGAQDFLIKGEFNGKQLIRAIRHSMLRFKKQIDLRKDAWQLQQQEKYNKRLLAWTKLGSWEMDVLDNTMTWSEEMYRILGFQPDSFAPKLSDYLRLVYNEDKEEVEEQLNEAIKTGKLCEIEHRALVNNRTVKYLQLRAQVTSLESSGKIIFISTVQDITDIHRALQLHISTKSDYLEKGKLSKNLLEISRMPFLSLAQTIAQLDENTSQHLIEACKLRFREFSDVFLVQYNICLLSNSDPSPIEKLVPISELKDNFLQIAFTESLAQNIRWDVASKESVLADQSLFALFTYNLLHTTARYYNHHFDLNVIFDIKKAPCLHLKIRPHKNSGLTLQPKALVQHLQELMTKNTFELSENRQELIDNALAKAFSQLKIALKVENGQDIELVIPLKLQNALSYLNGNVLKHPLRTLIVEHQSILQISLRRMLQANFQEMEINYAENLHDGDLKIRLKDYDFALLDAQIPVKNGVSVAQFLHNKKSIPVIALTSDLSDANKTALLKAGAINCISNPPQREELIEAIKKILEQ